MFKVGDKLERNSQTVIVIEADDKTFSYVPATIRDYHDGDWTCDQGSSDWKLKNE